jgi:hypothetical protein
MPVQHIIYPASLGKFDVNANGFPWWVVRKQGYPILTECNFSDTYPNTKFGTLVSGTGTVTSDTTNLRWGGTGCAKLLTEAVNLSGSEIKCTIGPTCQPGDLLAFEAKWAQSFAQGTTEFQLGLESRTHTTIYQARFSWTNTTGVWKYESGTGVYSDLSALPGSPPSCTIENPAVNTTAGTPISWARIVIDPFKREYYSFECPYVDLTSGAGYARVWDMRGVALPSNGAASRVLYLPFAYVINHTATAEPGFTTDWCVSIIPGA